MSSIVDTLKNKEDFISLKGANRENITAAEDALGVKFAQEYVEYVTAFGAASYYGHELTGVCKSKALDVVSITILEREFANVPPDWYVIEQAHIDDIVFWQSKDGNIYRTVGLSKPIKVFNSLVEYINLK